VTRVIAGRFGGRRLAVPPSGTRPTSDRAREGIFSTLGSLLAGAGGRGGFTGLRVLDLYAGSGAIGLEAWSRGAAHVVLVEAAPRAVSVAKVNIASLEPHAEPGTDAVVVAAKVASAIGELSPSGFDVVFADPPYDLPGSELADVLAQLGEHDLLADQAIVAVERAARDPWEWPEGFEAVRERRYGDAQVWYAFWYGRAARAGRENDGPVQS
jgi:16S rRNA (guanine966-N2)-methyltransferase